MEPTGALQRADEGSRLPGSWGRLPLPSFLCLAPSNDPLAVKNREAKGATILPGARTLYNFAEREVHLLRTFSCDGHQWRVSDVGLYFIAL